MANIVEGFGMRPYRSGSGAPWNNAQNKYTIKNNYGTAIFTNDLVIPTSTGNIERHVAGTSYVTIGVFNGCFYTDPTTKKPTFSAFYPGSIAAADIVANVIDDPDTVYLMDSDEAMPRASLNANYSLTNVTGSTLTGNSKVQLDTSTKATGATFAVRAIAISQDVNNEDTATANTNVLVRINQHFFRSGTGLA